MTSDSAQAGTWNLVSILEKGLRELPGQGAHCESFARP